MAIRLQRAPEKAAIFTGVAMLLRAWGARRSGALPWIFLCEYSVEKCFFAQNLRLCLAKYDLQVLSKRLLIER